MKNDLVVHFSLAFDSQNINELFTLQTLYTMMSNEINHVKLEISKTNRNTV